MPDKTDHRPPRGGVGEKETLVEFLNYLRRAMVSNVEGAPEPQVRTPGVPSGTSVLGLVKHLDHVERFYFLGEEVSDWSATFRPTTEDTIEGVLASYKETVSRANEIIDTFGDLSRPAPRSSRPQAAPTMRWILVHMIEETGRHAGHADILREQIDGATGR
jgi:Protein of unknown function (DUF664)